MMKLIVLVVVIAVAAAATDTEWTVYKAKHDKLYDGNVDRIRRGIYEDNLEKIKRHNELYAKGLKSFYLGENQFADMSSNEFVKTMNGFRPDLRTTVGSMNVPESFNKSLPTTVNWVKKGFVTGVKNQGQCGSCWAFSATGALEGAHFKTTGKLVSLSEQNLVDCSVSFGNHGCNGGLPVNAFKYVIANKGIDTEDSYPYKAKQMDTCAFKRSDVGSTEKSFTELPSGSEDALQQASAQIGPISVGIDANHRSFQLYGGGVYDEPECSPTALDHGVLVVGYGTYQGSDYWLVKNSWGPGWGLQGYIMMSRNKSNQCGIATMASYPVV